MSTIIKNVFIVYELGQIDEASKVDKKNTSVICLDYLLEEECRKRNIPFLPLRNFVDAETDEEKWWKLSHDIPREWHRLSSMEFFRYRNIPVGEAPEPIMQAYLAKLFYFVRIFINLKKTFPESHFSIPLPRVGNLPFGDCLAVFQPWAVIDAARMVEIFRGEIKERVIQEKYIFEPRQWKSFLLDIYNFFMKFIPRRRIKMYLSGYWTHAESLTPLLKDTEIIVLETKKWRSVPRKELLKHRMRFMYSHGAVNRKEEKMAQEAGEEFMKKWQGAEKEVSRYLSTIDRDLDWTPVLEACKHHIIYSPRVVADINKLYRIMEKEKPDLVLQMASVGGPHHYFFLMARVARELGIMSIELQHATVTSDPRSVFSRIETDYLLTYGPAINEWHERIGNDPKKLISTGSPRFDRHIHEQKKGKEKGKELMKNMGLDITKPIFLVPVPFSETYASAIDSYQLAEFFEVIKKVQDKTPGLQILFKCRVPKLVAMTSEHLKKSFSHDWAITGDEDIFPFICASDAVICNNSTVIYQAVLAGKPLILHPWKRFDSYHAKIYAQWIPLIYSAEEACEIIPKVFNDVVYREELIRKQQDFLRGYLFDGKSSERTAETIKKLAHKKG